MADDGPPKTLKAPCDKCATETRHEIICTIDTGGSDPDGSSWSQADSMIRCAGCYSVSLRRWYDFSEWSGPDVTFFPPRWTRPRPKWVNQLPDEHLIGLLDEVYQARRSNLVCLTAMGVRAVIDHVMRTEVGDIGGFEQKLQRLQKAGFIGGEQLKTLSVVVDAGSAAGHRGFKPAEALIDAMLDAVESMLSQRYIFGPMVQTLQRTIPPRPPPPPRDP